MNDRELLEMAAKAADIEIEFDPKSNLHWLGNKFSSINWSPLHMDGDALRLAVKLRMTIDVGLWDDVVDVRAYGVERGYGMYHIRESGELEAATRRAIVRAAAEIGRQMP